MNKILRNIGLVGIVLGAMSLPGCGQTIKRIEFPTPKPKLTEGQDSEMNYIILNAQIAKKLRDQNSGKIFKGAYNSIKSVEGNLPYNEEAKLNKIMKEVLQASDNRNDVYKLKKNYNELKNLFNTSLSNYPKIINSTDRPIESNLPYNEEAIGEINLNGKLFKPNVDKTAKPNKNIEGILQASDYLDYTFKEINLNGKLFKPNVDKTAKPNKNIEGILQASDNRNYNPDQFEKSAKILKNIFNNIYQITKSIEPRLIDSLIDRPKDKSDK